MYFNYYIFDERGESMFKAIVKRLGRTITALALSKIVALITGNPDLLWLAPALNAIGKALRLKYGIKYMPV